MTTTGPLARGRASLRRRAWGEAYAHLSDADRQRRLAPADAEGLATAAQLTGRDREATAAWGRAHRGWRRQGHPRSAARCAFWAGLPLLLAGATAQGGAWLARGRRALGDDGPRCAERGLLMVPGALAALRGGDAPAALAAFERVQEMGEAGDDPDAVAFGRLGRGQALVALGDAVAATAHLDEAMVAVTADETSPVAAGIVYCAVLLACRDLADLERAAEWTAALTRWCDDQGGLVPFRGECLVHRAEVLEARGEWSAALAEARRACDHLDGRAAAGRAHHRRGDIHRLRGEGAEAERAYRQAQARGTDPQPGWALLRLAQGRAGLACAMVGRALADARGPVARAALLPAAVEIHLAAGDLPSARRAGDELAAAGATAAPARRAAADRCRGALLLAEGRARPALAPLRRSLDAWRRLAAPHEEACTRLVLARALADLGEDGPAALEDEAARAALGRLGAGLDAGIAPARDAPPPGDGGAPLTAREREVLVLVADGCTNPQVAGRLVISHHTVRRHLQNAFRKLGASSRAEAVAVAAGRGLIAPAGWHGRAMPAPARVARPVDGDGGRRA